MFVDRRRSESFAISTFPKEKLDLDGLRKARYPRITKRATKRVSVLSLWCDQRQETKFVSCYVFLEPFTPLASRLISIKYVTHTVKSQ